MFDHNTPLPLVVPPASKMRQAQPVPKRNSQAQWVPLDKNEGGVKAQFCRAMVFHTASWSEWFGGPKLGISHGESAFGGSLRQPSIRP